MEAQMDLPRLLFGIDFQIFFICVLCTQIKALYIIKKTKINTIELHILCVDKWILVSIARVGIQTSSIIFKYLHIKGGYIEVTEKIKEK